MLRGVRLKRRVVLVISTLLWSKPFVNLLGWAFAPGPMAFASGAAGLYNTFSGADGLIDHANAIWDDPNSSAGDLAKATYQLILKPAVAMVVAPVVRATDVAIKINPKVLEAEAKAAETGMEHGLQEVKHCIHTKRRE